MDGSVLKHIHRYIDTLHCRMSCSSFRWRLCCWERNWPESSASCGQLSLLVDCSSADVQTHHDLSYHVTCVRIYQNLSESFINYNYTSNQNDTKRATPTTTTEYQTTEPLSPMRFRSSTPFPLRFHSKSTLHSSSYLLLALQKFITRSTNICNLDSGSSCLCVSSCKHCSQSAASAVSATAACTVSALAFSDRNDVDELNFQGHTETDSRNMSKYLRLGNTSEQSAEQTATTLKYIRVLHLGWSSMCFTALVGLIDSQMLQAVLCFFLLPGCSSASTRARLG